MLAPGFEFRGFGSRDWTRAVRLFPFPSGGPASGSTVEAPRGVIALGHPERLWSLLRVGVGLVPLDSVVWPSTAEELASRLAAPWVMKLHPSAFLEIQERFGARLRPTDSLQNQWVKLLVAVQELVNESTIDVWPRSVFNWPTLLRENLAHSALELLCPPGKCLVLGAFAQGELYTALVLRRGAQGIDLVLGPAELRAGMGLLSGDWFRDQAHLVAVVERAVGPVAGGCFGQADCLRRLLADRTPGAFAQAVAARELVLDPVSPALAVSLGIDVGRAALAGMQSLTERLARSPLAQHPAVERMKKGGWRRSHIEGLIGFDPISALSKLILDGKDKN